MNSIIECVPNFSEGRNIQVIENIANSIRKVTGVKLLHIDSGYAAHRTVMTFIGNPEAVVEAAFNAIEKASFLIDMRKHHGTHPRLGATDVCPLIPMEGVSMKETIVHAHQLSQRVAEELNIPVYCYEEAALHPQRISLAYCRKGEYENLENKLLSIEGYPDFGTPLFNAHAGATIIGARQFLGAYNVNLNTQDVQIAKRIAEEMRKIKFVKAIGWYIPEYKKAQVSMNLCNMNISPIHVVYEKVKKLALKYGAKVTGSELIGMLPKHFLLDAGKYYTRETKHEDELITIAIEQLRLDELKPFIPQEKLF